MSIRFSPGEVNIICSDLARSLHFYHRVLGFDISGYEGDAAVHLNCGGRPFLLLAVAGPAEKHTPYCSVPAFSFDLMVADIGEAYEHLRRHEVSFELPYDPGDRRFFVRDPDGLVIEIIEEKHS